VSLRLPDFLVIGAVKSGTTTLYHWLEQQPEIFMSPKKEPRFFDKNWDRGTSWYAEFFTHARDDQLAGEASPQYSNLDAGALAAERIAALLPDARLVYLVRHPVDRMLSEYRYNVQRKLVDGSFLEKDRERIVGASCYHARLSPYIERFPREQICVVRFEDMINADGAGWTQILRHLGLADRPSPGTVHNVTRNYPKATPMTRRLSSMRRKLGLPRPPAALRSALARSRPPVYVDPVTDDDLPVLDEVAPQVWDDITRLEAWLGVSDPLWSRSA